MGIEFDPLLSVIERVWWEGRLIICFSVALLYANGRYS